MPMMQLQAAIRRGIGPAMQCSYQGTTFWGQELPSEISEAQKCMFGHGLPTPECIRIGLEQAWSRARNARQYMAERKGGFGGGDHLISPDEQDIEGDMPEDINVYGDGSVKCPSTQHWSIAGFGLWWPGTSLQQADLADQMPPIRHVHQLEWGGGVGQRNSMQGQCGSSTRMELVAWLGSLVRRAPIHMGSDSQALITKANIMMDAARRWSYDSGPGRWLRRNPFRKPWGLQPDGDLWQAAWGAILQRGLDNQKLSKVKGHATRKQVEEGTVVEAHKEGNDWADWFADKGARQHTEFISHGAEQNELGLLAKWMKSFQEKCVDLMTRIHGMIAAVLIAEKAERKHRKAVQCIASGFDGEKEAIVTCTLPQCQDDEGQAIKLDLLPLVAGLHRLGSCRIRSRALLGWNPLCSSTPRATEVLKTGMCPARSSLSERKHEAESE